jgi:asparagine synthase (glutamine-hydrolysing)
MKVTLAVLDKDGKNAVNQIIEVLESFECYQPAHFGLTTPTKSLNNEKPELLSKQAPQASTAVGFVSFKSKEASGYQTLQLADEAVFFEGRMYSPILQEDAIKQLTKEPKRCEVILQTLLEKSDGDYAFFMLNKEWITAGRDPVGVQPLYFGETKKIVALASNRTALWKLGIEEPKSFPPGNLAFCSKDGFRFKAVKTLVYPEVTPVSLDDVSVKLQGLLEKSIQSRIQGLKEVAVAFSGGLDSSIVAFLAKKSGVKVQLIHVSLENQAETEEAIKGADLLDLPIQINLYKETDVEDTLPKVVNLIEEADPIKASVGVPFYWVANNASESGYKVLLAGQGADELFGGYQRYVNEYCQNGSEAVRRTMFGDVAKIHESNLERDMKICAFHDVELRLPFGQIEIAQYAQSLPVELKIEPKADSLRKLVLRKTALKMGVPDALADKPKKAVQYSTGINNVLKKLAKKNGKTVNDYVNQLFQH